jgi:hypothetical protein
MCEWVCLLLADLNAAVKNSHVQLRICVCACVHAHMHFQAHACVWGQFCVCVCVYVTFCLKNSSLSSYS